MSHHRIGGFAVALAVAAAACSSTSAAQHASVSEPTTSVASTTTRASTTTTPPPKPPNRSVTPAFASDVHFEGILRGKLAAAPATVLAPIAPILRRADIAMVNLETAITERGVPQAKVYTFRAPPTALDALAAAGVDVANEANNHGIDFGPVGLLDTLAARAQSKRVALVGIGCNADDAYTPFRATVHGLRIAIIGASQVIDTPFISTWSATDAQPGIASAKDIDRLLAAVRAGHLGSALVDYGLGNFAFYSGTTSGVLTVTMTGRRVDRYGWEPASIVGGVPNPVPGPARQPAIDAWRSLRGRADLAP